MRRIVVDAVIDVPSDVAGALPTFWAEALGWPLGAPWPGHPELRSLEPPRGTPYVHLQEAGAEPRVHLDLRVDGRSEADALVTSALDNGACLVGRQDRWRTLLSPGGLPFCVVDGTGDAPGPETWADGHRSRLVQVCVDAQRDAHATEVHFWRGLLEGRWVESRSDEFGGKWHCDGSPLQLLFQRLDEPGRSVRAHLDLGTDDLAAEVRRLVGLGAEDVGPGRGWHVLRDPAGLAFCATENAPDGARDRDLG
ncbi:VOC family protein [Nocardioides KLBMP 9356]|uniref:VOC family protein n=1 Tax=Nocardioides potassii TaxID=2911371 RepID=A0ABS9HDL2_9ACTN|nr:VOC family protein [Nocardioides potassii]MCF6379285.1 VOC family protein [Nocardioides potassii]